MVPLADFESFKRTIEARVQALEEALEQKDDEVQCICSSNLSPRSRNFRNSLLR